MNSRPTAACNRLNVRNVQHLGIPERLISYWNTTNDLQRFSTSVGCSLHFANNMILYFDFLLQNRCMRRNTQGRILGGRTEEEVYTTAHSHGSSGHNI